MGYYINLEKSTFIIKKQEEAYKAVCELNKKDNLKNGGSFSGGKKQAAWFSWMDENYPETCKDCQAVFEMLGFETEQTEEGLKLISYDSKAGQEGLFIEAAAPFSEGTLWFSGEDDCRWKYIVENGKFSKVEERTDWYN